MLITTFPADEDYKPVQSDGVIPENRLPADQFSFSYSFTYETDAEGFGVTHTTIKADLVFDIKDASGALKATFTAHEEYDVTMIQFVEGLVEYSWNWVGSKEKFTAVDGSGNPIPSLGEFTRGLDPAEDSDYSDKSAYIITTFFSKIYKLDLQPGDNIKIRFHTVNAGLSKTSLHIATRLGEGIFDVVREPNIGQSWTLYTDDGSLYCATSHTKNKIKTTSASGSRVLQKAPKSAALYRRAPNLLCLAEDDANLQVLKSADDGAKWESLMIVDVGLKALASTCSADGSVMYVYGVGSGGATGLTSGKPAFAVLKKSDESWVTSARGLCEVTAAQITGDGDQENTGEQSSSATVEDMPVKGSVRLELLEAKLRLTSKGEAEVAVWASMDEMRSWSALS